MLSICATKRNGGMRMRFCDDYAGLFGDGIMEEIKRAAYEIIEGIGMRVPDAALREKLIKAGFVPAGGRVAVSRGEAEAFLGGMIARERERERAQEREREQMRAQESENTQTDAAGNDGGTAAAGRPKGYLDGWINNYPHSYVDPVSGEIIRYDKESLIKMTAFCNRIGNKSGFTPNVPGCPADVPPSCKSVAGFVIGSKYIEGGVYPEPMCRHSAKYLFEMCGALGIKISSLPVYLPTPLTFGDESLLVALENSGRLERIGVYSMPSFGANTPLSITGALALVLAETLLGAIIVGRLTGLETVINPSLFAFDFKDLNQAFGTPETLTLQFICNSFNNKLFGRGASEGWSGVEIHTHTIRPGVQAAAEKAIAMAAGYMKAGAARSVTFRGMGILGMDELFSPAQLIVDAELLNYVKRLDAGYEISHVPEDFADEVRDCIDKGFISSERTAARYREYMRHSDLFTRANMKMQMQSGARAAEKTAGAKIASGVKTASGAKIIASTKIIAGAEEAAAAIAAAELRRPAEMVLDTATAATLDKLLIKAIENA